jgi:cytidine deaminase
MIEKITEQMLNQARLALPYAYAPYSNFKVASCIYTDRGNLYTGVNIENTSYSLTLCAEATAIANMVSAGEQRIQKILIIAANEALCSPCGACRQRIFEFSNPATQVYLCRDNAIIQSMSMSELLPLPFDFKSPQDHL